jgi:FkbM family methyltransferase
MFLKKFIKTCIKKILYNPFANAVLRWMLKPIYFKIPLIVINRFPIVGTICLRLPKNQKLYLTTQGNNPITTNVYWRGLNGYEKNTIQIFLKLLNFVDTFIDVGANIGLYALIAAIENRRRNVYAFEPVKRIFDNFKKNVEINKLTNLAVNCSAITNFVGDTKIYIPSEDIPLSASTLRGFRNVHEAITVKALTLDYFVVANNVSKVDIIKIDTEATEHLVLEGAKMLLKRDKPIIICEVLKGRTENFLQSILNKFEYQFFWINDSRLIRMKKIEGDNTYRHSNYLFIPENKLNLMGLK